MEEAVVGLIGVVVGGIIAIIGQIFLANFNYKKWQKETSIEILKDRRRDLEEKYALYIGKLSRGLKEERFDTEMVFEFEYLFPKNVYDAFHKMMDEEQRDSETKQTHFFIIVAAMKKSLADIDQEIKDEIAKK
jgi:hypothetical protein